MPTSLNINSKDSKVWSVPTFDNLFTAFLLNKHTHALRQCKWLLLVKIPWTSGFNTGISTRAVPSDTSMFVWICSL